MDRHLRGHWFGFDCAHYQEPMPFIRSMLYKDAMFRETVYVKAELIKLVRQLKMSSKK